MRKPPYVPTSKQGIPEVDAAQFFAIDGIGMEYAGELLVAMKIAKFAAETWAEIPHPPEWTFADWLKVCKSEFEVK